MSVTRRQKRAEFMQASRPIRLKYLCLPPEEVYRFQFERGALVEADVVAAKRWDVWADGGATTCSHVSLDVRTGRLLEKRCPDCVAPF